MISKNRIKYYSSLKQKKVRDLEQRFLIEGVRLCEEAVASDYEIEALLYCPANLISERTRAVIERAQKQAIPVETIDERAVKQISDTVQAQGLIGIVKKKHFDFQDLLEMAGPVVAFDEISDPGNLGTILRSASWFGIDGVLLSRNSVDVSNPKTLRASMGGFFHLKIIHDVDLPKALKKLQTAGYQVYAVDVAGANSYTDVAFSSQTVLVFGSEATGVRENIKSLTSTTVMIPRVGTGESLNLSVAAGILFAEIARRKP